MLRVKESEEQMSRLAVQEKREKERALNENAALLRRIRVLEDELETTRTANHAEEAIELRRRLEEHGVYRLSLGEAVEILASVIDQGSGA